jgi:hypothetical protein
MLVCSTTLICEQLLFARLRRVAPHRVPLVLVETRIDIQQPEMR